MVRAQEKDRPVALSRLDLPDWRESLVYGCEDCACPVSYDPDHHEDTASSSVVDGESQWICGREVTEVRVDGEHVALFNPVGNGGVAVINRSAHQIFTSFSQPATFKDVQTTWPGDGDDAARIATRLGQLEMIHVADRTPSPRIEPGKVLTAWLHVTNACNLRCPYCCVAKSSEKMDEPVGMASVEAVVRSAVVNGFPAVKLKYAGGEASLNHRLMLKMHARAKELAASNSLRLYATLLSNGVALPPLLVETLKAEGIRIMLSLDGLGAQHDIQRPFASGKPSFHLVERTIAQLMEQGHPPHLSITITNRNAGGVADVVRFALERDLTFSLNLFRDNDCAASFPDLQYEESAIISALHDAFGVIEAFLPPWSVLGSVLDRGQLVQPRQRPCGVGQDYLVIDHHGRVAKCHMEIEKTLGDVFTGDPLLLIQRDKSLVQNLAVEEKEGCRDCTWRYWCSGGCAVATFRATGRYDIKSPNCRIYKAIYPEALRLEGLRLLKYAAARNTTLRDGVRCGRGGPRPIEGHPEVQQISRSAEAGRASGAEPPAKRTRC